MNIPGLPGDTFAGYQPTPAPIALDLDGRITFFPPEIPLGMPLFAPLFIDDWGLLVTGAPTALYLFQAVDGEALTPYATLPAQVWITAFTYHGGVLYVQDGCVLTAWTVSGTAPAAPSASINLATGAHCAGAATPAVLQLSGDAATRQQGLLRARRREAWGVFLDAAQFSGQEFLRQVQAVMGSTAAGYDASLFPDVLQQARIAAEAASPDLVFSAPVVRENQADVGKFSVFVLGANGTLHRLDGGLTAAKATHTDGAAVPMLAAWEPDAAEDPGASELFLFYVAGDGTLRMLDANSDPPRLVASCPSRGAPNGAILVPLQVTDDVLWGGGVLASDCFALPLALPPATLTWAPVLDVASPYGFGWQGGVEVDEVRKLALVTGGSGPNVALECYAAEARVRARWGTAGVGGMPSSGWVVFGPAPDDGTPRLVLGLCPWRTAMQVWVYAANTVDTPGGAGVFPPPMALASGSLGAEQGLTGIPARPVVAGGSLYLVATTSSLAAQAAVLATTRSAAGFTRFQDFVAGLVGEYGSVTAAAQAPAGVNPPPPSGTADTTGVCVCPLGGLDAVTSAAQAYLQEMATLPAPPPPPPPSLPTL